MAESGIAARWMYKAGGQTLADPAALAADWLQNLLEMQREAGNSVEFLEHVKVDLFPGEVYVFTPKGRILNLKRGATVVDFALCDPFGCGQQLCGGAHRPADGGSERCAAVQTVEIITAPGAANPGWLNFVVTGKARKHSRLSQEHPAAGGASLRATFADDRTREFQPRP